MKCISKSEDHREIIQSFQNLRKDGQTDRKQIDSVSRILSLKTQINLIVMHCVNHFFRSFMNYTAVYQQQETGH